MRTTAGSALPDTAIIQAQTYNSDGGGGGTTVWAATGTVDCRYAPLIARGDERETGERIEPYDEFVITLPFDTTVDTTNRIVIGSETFDIQAVNNRSWNLTTRAEATRRV